jgi:hypothetical protein
VTGSRSFRREFRVEGLPSPKPFVHRLLLDEQGMTRTSWLQRLELAVSDQRVDRLRVDAEVVGDLLRAKESLRGSEHLYVCTSARSRPAETSAICEDFAGPS